MGQDTDLRARGTGPDAAPMATAESAPSRPGRHAPAALGYVVLTVWVLWPAVSQFRTRVTANAVDGAMFTWLWGAMPSAVAAGDNPYRTDLMFHPIGADLELTTSSPLIALVTLPIRETLGTAAQVNALQLVSMFFAGMATYLLANRVSRHRGAAFVAGVAYALLPGRFFHVDGHLNLIETAVIPVGLLLFLRFTDAPSRRRAAALGGAFGATFLIDPQLTILLGIGLLCVGVVHRRMVVAQAKRLIGAALLAVVVAAPLLVPMAAAIASGNHGEADPTSSTLQYSSSPLSWVVPPLERLWLGRFASIEPITPNWEGVAFPGLAMLGLAVAGVSLTPRDRRRGWVAISLVGFVLSLGPYLFVRNTSLPVPLPFFALRLVPGLDAMRVPGRFAMLGALGIYVLAAAALADVVRRVPRRAILAVALAGVVTVIELFPAPTQSRNDDVSDAYEVLARHPSRGAVLEIPLKWSTTQEQIGFEEKDQDFRYLLFQSVHGRPTVSGAVSRYPDAELDALLETPVYRQVLALGDEPGFDDPARFDGNDLAALDIGFVVYHRDDPVPRALAYLRSLDLPVLADDGTVIIWKVDP